MEVSYCYAKTLLVIFFFLCKKLKKPQRVLILFFMSLYFQNVLFQLSEEASRVRVLVIASGEC